MATPTLGTNNITPLDEALLHQCLSAGGKLNCKVNFARIRYAGSAWELFGDSAELVAGNVTWNLDALTITVTGYTALPVVLVSRSLNSYLVEARAASPESVLVQFRDAAGVLIEVEDALMDFSCLIIGS